MKNDFYAIACEDLKYLQATLHLPYYNQIAVQSQQVAEKMIKSVAERCVILKFCDSQLEASREPVRM